MGGNDEVDVFQVGKHCESQSCNRLDFLSVKCDGCGKNFCNEHFNYERHHCSSGRVTNNQVPVCPLCNAPVSVNAKRGEFVDVVVNKHIESDCTSDVARNKRRVYINACSVKGCRKKEMMKIDCQECQKSFCLAHRMPQDHQCHPVSPKNRAAFGSLCDILNLGFKVADSGAVEFSDLPGRSHCTLSPSFHSARYGANAGARGSCACSGPCSLRSGIFGHATSTE